MDLDESFAAYVGARWSMLYRLAAVLAGEEEADELAQQALVRVYLRWSEIREHAATDDVVKRTFAVTAAERRGTSTGADAAAVTHGRPALAEEIDRLLPRQRAILVLRHYELLSDTEIAEALRCSTESVTAEVRALETGVDPADLREELVQTAHDVDVPLPPTAALLVRGRQSRRRRARRGLVWAAAASVLVVAGLALGNLVQSRTSDRPTPASPSASSPRFLSLLPSGKEPRIAYSVGRLLHLGDDQLVLSEQPSGLVQTRHWLFVTYLSGEIARLDARSRRFTTVAETSRGELVTDPSGDHVVWLAGGSGRAVVEVQTVDAEHAVPVSDQQVFPAAPRCCDNPFVVNGMTSDGEVIASLPATNRAWVWATPDGGTEDPVREISGLGNGVISQVTAGGVVVQYLPSHFAFGVLEDDAFLVRGELNARQADFSDPLGHRVVYADTDGEIHVREAVSRGRSRRGSQDVRLGLPVLDAGFSAARWEDAEHVLLDVSDASAPAGALVRCEVQTGRCEVAARFSAPHLLAR